MKRTNATLESLATAQRAELDALKAQMAALLQSQTPPAPKAPEPVVIRGFFKALNPATGKWDIDDTTRPCVIIGREAGVTKGVKMSVANFEKLFLTRHAEIVAAYKASK